MRPIRRAFGRERHRGTGRGETPGEGARHRPRNESGSLQGHITPLGIIHARHRPGERERLIRGRRLIGQCIDSVGPIPTAGIVEGRVRVSCGALIAQSRFEFCLCAPSAQVELQRARGRVGGNRELEALVQPDDVDAGRAIRRTGCGCPAGPRIRGGIIVKALGRAAAHCREGADLRRHATLVVKAGRIRQPPVCPIRGAFGGQVDGGSGSRRAGRQHPRRSGCLQSAEAEILLGTDRVGGLGVGLRGGHTIAITSESRLAQGIVLAVLDIGRGAIEDLVQQWPVVGITHHGRRAAGIGHGEEAAQTVIGTLRGIGRPIQGLVRLRDPSQGIVAKDDGAGGIDDLLEAPIAIVRAAIIGVDDIPSAGGFLRGEILLRAPVERVIAKPKQLALRIRLLRQIADGIVEITPVAHVRVMHGRLAAERVVGHGRHIALGIRDGEQIAQCIVQVGRRGIGRAGGGVTGAGGPLILIDADCSPVGILGLALPVIGRIDAHRHPGAGTGQAPGTVRQIQACEPPQRIVLQRGPSPRDGFDRLEVGQAPFPHGPPIVILQLGDDRRAIRPTRLSLD